MTQPHTHKLLSLAAALALFTPVLAACGSSPSKAPTSAPTKNIPVIATAPVMPTTPQGVPGGATAAPTKAMAMSTPALTAVTGQPTAKATMPSNQPPGAKTAVTVNTPPVAAATAALLNLGQLSPDIPDPTHPVTITFMSWISAGLKPLAAEFHKLHPNITIKFQDVPSGDEEATKLDTQLAGGNPPDAAYVDAGAVGAYASRGVLVNLDQFIPKSKAVDVSDYLPAWRLMSIYQNHTFGLPIDGESTGLFYRTDLFKAAGITHPPTTWQEFQQDAQKLTNPAKKQYGFAVFATPGETSYYFLSWLWQAGGDTVSPDGKTVTLNTPQAKKAASFYVGLKQYAPRDLLGSNSWDARTAFAQGEVGMYVAGAWFMGEMIGSQKKAVGNNWAAAPLPCDVHCANQVAGDSLVIFNKSPNQAAAWKWIEFLSAPQNMLRINLGTPQNPSTLLPPRRSLLSNPILWKNLPQLKSFVDAMKYGRIAANGKYIPNYGKVQDALDKNLGKAFYGQETPDQAMENATKEGQAGLNGH